VEIMRFTFYGHFSFFFQAEDGIRDRNVTGVQTCALPILTVAGAQRQRRSLLADRHQAHHLLVSLQQQHLGDTDPTGQARWCVREIGRASCREREWVVVGDVSEERNQRSRGTTRLTTSDDE